MLNMEIPFIAYTGIAHGLANEFTVFDANDPIGVVVKQFTIAQNFGIGEHEVCSEKNILPFSQGSCDYTLKFHIEEI
jgi:hypothetical protein